ncbi:MAG TPA: hypothetical protein VD994_19695 [Prosthecobacter sp.]|nr:hypothetical protein [Prosthecobacter sp.]
MKPSYPFKVGKTYLTKAGKAVRVTSQRHCPPCFRGSDGIWRYNRIGDLGRVTGSAHDRSDPNCFVTPPQEVQP